MLTALVILGVLLALFLAAALATRDSQALAPAPPDAADLVLPERMGGDDVRGLRFGLAVRGYRMSEVDVALERLAAELEERDRRIAELTAEGTGKGAGTGDGPVEVDGVMTAGLGEAGAGMDPLLPSVPAPDAEHADDAPAVDVPAVPHGDDAFTVAPDATPGQVPSEPVDPSRRTA